MNKSDSNNKFKFKILNQHNKARRGKIYTKHGIINTPAFMPVGTRATVKSMLPESVSLAGGEIILANTYHLMLRPTENVIEELGGLHKFMNWPGPILTDSGGFQIMSLSSLRKISDHGVEFKSHIDGTKYMLTPEYSTKIQHMLDSTITMMFDECISHPANFLDTEKSTNLTSKWGKRSRNAFIERDGYAQFGIVQGGMYKELREKSAKELIELEFDGYAVGGLAVGESQELMLSILDHTTNMLPIEKARYLMGVGKPDDIVKAVSCGIDMFDCVIPTRSGRNGQAFTKYGTINIRNSKFAKDNKPIEEDCECPACLNYSKAYLHHVVKVKEIIAPMLLTWHNIQYFQRLMAKIRSYIENGKNFDFIC